MHLRQVSGAAGPAAGCVLHYSRLHEFATGIREEADLPPGSRMRSPLPNAHGSLPKTSNIQPIPAAVCYGSHVCPDESPLGWIPRLPPLRYTREARSWSGVTWKKVLDSRVKDPI